MMNYIFMFHVCMCKSLIINYLLDGTKCTYNVLWIVSTTTCELLWNFQLQFFGKINVVINNTISLVKGALKRKSK